MSTLPATIPQARSLDEIAHTRNISVLDAFFIALLKIGTPAKHAYLLIRPHVKETSAQPCGARLKRKLRAHIDSLGIAEAQILLTDVRLATLVATAPPDIALRASDQINKLLGRYQDAGTVINITAEAREALTIEHEPPPLE